MLLIVRLRMLKVVTISLHLHLQQEKPTLNFENFHSKIQSAFRKILIGNFKKQVTTPEGKAFEKRSLTGRKIVWMICDFLNDNEAILDLRDLSKVHITERQRSNFRHKVGRSIMSSHLTDLLTTYWRASARCKLKSENMCCKSTL